MADIKIVIDTGADMPAELIEKYDFSVIRFLSIFGETSYVQGVDITTDEFYDKLENEGVIPTTSQTPVGDSFDFFRDLAEKHDTVIYFCLSGAASGQYQSATLVANELMDENPEFDIRIVDTRLFSIFISITAVYAAELVKAGKSADEVVAESVEYMESWRAYFLVETLEYLQKGGRLSKGAAIVGSLLDIKPVLTIEDGLVTTAEKLRGKKKLIDKLLNIMEEDEDFINCDVKEFAVIESHGGKGDEIEEKLIEQYGEDSILMRSSLGPLIGTHVGPGTSAVLFRIKK